MEKRINCLLKCVFSDPRTLCCLNCNSLEFLTCVDIIINSKIKYYCLKKAIVITTTSIQLLLPTGNDQQL